MAMAGALLATVPTARAAFGSSSVDHGVWSVNKNSSLCSSKFCSRNCVAFVSSSRRERYLRGLGGQECLGGRGSSIFLDQIVAEKFDPKKLDPNNVINTLVRVGKQGFEAGTKLVPDTVPRPVAQLGVGLVGLFVGSFIIRSLFSTVFFILAVGGLGYIAFVYLTKGEAGNSSGNSYGRDSDKPKSTDEALEEARKIMDKYK